MIESELLNFALTEFGPTVSFLIIMVWLFTRSNEQHRVERSEWREDITKSSQDFLQSHKETQEVIRELTRVIETIK